MCIRDSTKSVAGNANGSYTLNIPDAIEAIPTRAITRDNNKKDDDYNIEDDITYDKERGVVYHPKKGWGTIMSVSYTHLDVYKRQR